MEEAIIILSSLILLGIISGIVKYSSSYFDYRTWVLRVNGFFYYVFFGWLSYRIYRSYKHRKYYQKERQEVKNFYNTEQREAKFEAKEVERVRTLLKEIGIIDCPKCGTSVNLQVAEFSTYGSTLEAKCSSCDFSRTFTNIEQCPDCGKRSLFYIGDNRWCVCCPYHYLSDM